MLLCLEMQRNATYRAEITNGMEKESLGEGMEFYAFLSFWNA